ncbi:hypothetical protein [Enterobacter sp.]|uniref:hypothetical protein n=1 Tax=Enterobacter sp. TaxID=42895 RepID=UPI00296EBCE3|nr:hypothetical protein [Enterobacter sp.]
MDIFDKNDVFYFPEKITYDFNYQKKNFWRWHYTSANVKSLDYKILLPVAVKPISVKPMPVEGLYTFYTIGFYQTMPESQYPFMEVDVVYEHIENDIDASDWLDYVLSLLGETVVHRNDYYSVSGKYPDVLTSNRFDGDKVISRIRVFKNYDFEHGGADMIMVKASCPHKDYESLSEDFLHCVKFFTLINDSKWHLAEELKSINLNVPASYSFFYPASWLHTERYNNEKVSYCSLSLKRSGKTYGSIDSYFLYSNTTMNKDIICEIITNKLKKHEHNQTEKIFLEEKTDIFNKNISELWSCTLRVNGDNKNIIYVFAGRTRDTWFYFIIASITREDSFILWATTKRTIDIIINSLNNYELSYEDVFYKKN